MTVQPSGAVIGGRYEVVGTLGKGGFGRTFLAQDRQSGARVAIKMLDAGKAEDLKAFELFEREASVLRSLRHHGIPEVYASLRDRWEGVEAAFLVMEYVDGASLARIIDERRHLAPDDVLHLLVELLGILDYLHGRVPPILHRDVKPANIIIRPSGTPALVDFGAVRSVFKAPDESGSTVVGTYGYMPYEQYMGQATPASDLYALGATLLHVLTGRQPSDFMSDEGRIKVPESLPGDERLRDVVARLLRPSPTERFQTAREARSALLSTSGGVSVIIAGERRPLPVPRGAGALPELPQAPRALVGDTRALYQRAAPSTWDLMNASVKPGEGIGLWDILVVAFFSIITVGVLPIVFFSMARDRRRRLRRFFKEGTPAVGVITGIELEDTAFGEKLARVSYEFQADGAARRDADLTLPAIAHRLREGDSVQLLYIAERDYDSVMIGT